MTLWINDFDTENYAFAGWKINGTLYNANTSLASFDGFTDYSESNWGDPSRVVFRQYPVTMQRVAQDLF